MWGRSNGHTPDRWRYAVVRPIVPASYARRHLRAAGSRDHRFLQAVVPKSQMVCREWRLRVTLRRPATSTVGQVIHNQRKWWVLASGLFVLASEERGQLQRQAEGKGGREEDQLLRAGEGARPPLAVGSRSVHPTAPRR